MTADNIVSKIGYLSTSQVRALSCEEQSFIPPREELKILVAFEGSCSRMAERQEGKKFRISSDRFLRVPNLGGKKATFSKYGPLLKGFGLKKLGSPFRKFVIPILPGLLGPGKGGGHVNRHSFVE